MPDNSLETGLYTLTPTHCGTGQAAGAVDLPIARERHTGFPLIPATSLKGVVRDLADGDRGGAPWDDEKRREVLGSDPPGESGSREAMRAGHLVLTDARLLAFPVRSLQAPFLWVTCPLVVERWARDRRALGLDSPHLPAIPSDQPVAVAGSLAAGGGLVLEDHFFAKAEVAWAQPGVAELARRWARLLPCAEKATRSGFLEKLAVVPDPAFQDLVRRSTPISARVQLTGGKTTDRWPNPDTGKDETGNLWYEETLPPDCLFSVLATSRRRSDQDVDALSKLLADPHHETIQIGGNETVGQGLCWWRPAEDCEDD